MSAVSPVRRADAGGGALPVGVLGVMAYGGPASLEEIPGYLADIRAAGRRRGPFSRRSRPSTRAIGGRSPLLEVSRRQVERDRCRLGPALSLLPRDAPLVAVDRGGRRRDHRRTASRDAVSLVLAPQLQRAVVDRQARRAHRGGLDLYRGSMRVPAPRATTTDPGWSRRSLTRVEEDSLAGPRTSASASSRLQRPQPPRRASPRRAIRTSGSCSRPRRSWPRR